MIDYGLIADAERFYQSKGYKLINVPWIIGKDAYYATKPPFARDVRCSVDPQYADDYLQGFLPGSGEQSLLDIIIKGKKLTKVVATTPCFRVEEYNEFHQPWFIKTELMLVSDNDDYQEMMAHSVDFYMHFLPVRIVTTEEGHDIVGARSGIELGSYGVRYIYTQRFGKIRWLYGTGVAEPRTSQVIRLENNMAQ